MPREGIHAMRRAHKAEREEKIKATLAKKPEDPGTVFQRAFGGTPFRNLHKKYRKFATRQDGWSTLSRLIGFRGRWVRPVEDWKPKGKAVETVLRSLVTHLICRYPMPAFWYEVWFQHRFRGQPEDENHGFCDVFVRLAQGEGLYRLIQEDEFPVKFTKKQAHAFMQQRGVNSVVQASRWTQVESFGGDRRLSEALCKTDWGETFANELFRAQVIQWFCNQAMIDPAQVGPLLDYIEHAREMQEDFSMKGRTGRSLMRDMEEWHRVLAEDRRVMHREARAAQRTAWAERRKPPPEVFKPSGIRNWEMTRKTKDKAGRQVHIRYAVTELLTYEALRDEGRELSHCVSSYAWSIGKGQKSIWSFSIAKEKQLTIEVRNATRTVVQIRGKRNRQATVSELSFVQRWASENGLVLINRAFA